MQTLFPHLVRGVLERSCIFDLVRAESRLPILKLHLAAKPLEVVASQVTRLPIFGLEEV